MEYLVDTNILLRLTATMKANNITYILTFNTGDFIRYASEGIIAVNPNNV
jgi:predicted nucleic acid-binding protein